MGAGDSVEAEDHSAVNSHPGRVDGGPNQDGGSRDRTGAGEGGKFAI